jgi:large subunit ribosomal protein L35
MPKMKTVSSAKKRFKVKKNGSIKRGSAFRSHILTKKDQKRKLGLRAPQTIDKADVKSVKAMLGK